MTKIIEAPSNPIISDLRRENPNLCLCGKVKFNKACTLKLCSGCCKKNNLVCALAKHQQNKIAPLTQPFIDQINEAIKTGHIVWVKYNAGSNPGSYRPLKVQSWINEKIRFKAECQNSAITKDYFVNMVAFLPQIQELH